MLFPFHHHHKLYLLGVKRILKTGLVFFLRAHGGPWQVLTVTSPVGTREKPEKHDIDERLYVQLL